MKKLPQPHIGDLIAMRTNAVILPNRVGIIREIYSDRILYPIVAQFDNDTFKRVPINLDEIWIYKCTH